MSRKAARYALLRRPALERSLDDPRSWIDNNPTERAIRGPVVGRRNHHGSKSRRGTRVAAVFYTLLETAKLQDIDATDWLKAIVERAKDDPDAVVLPNEL